MKINWNLFIYIKLALAILFLLCLLQMPYGFYELVRFAALLGFSLLAYQQYQEKNNKFLILYIALALLFQPFFKIALGREIWNIVDVIVSVGLVYSVVKLKIKKDFQ
jgi:hypothetical protein